MRFYRAVTSKGFQSPAQTALGLKYAVGLTPISITGLVSVAISAAQPGVAMSTEQPGIAMSTEQPAITITAEVG